MAEQQDWPRQARPERVIDLTERGEQLRYVEIITRGGVIRVNTNLVTTQGGHDRVVVEVEPSTRDIPRSGDGGHWETIVHQAVSRTDIVLTRHGEI